MFSLLWIPATEATTIRSASSKSIGLSRFQTANSPHFLYDRKMRLLQVLKSREESFSPLLRRESLDGVEDPASSEKQTEGAAWKGSEPADHAMRLCTLEFFKHSHGLLKNNTLYALENSQVFEWSVAKFLLTAPALSLGSATLKDELDHPLQLERPARFRPLVVELDD